MSVVRKPAGAELIDLLDRLLDKGKVVDAASRLYLTAAWRKRERRRVVILSVETFLRQAEARVVAGVNRRQPLRSLQPPAQIVPRSGRGR